jgi:hypothetical protein
MPKHSRVWGLAVPFVLTLTAAGRADDNTLDLAALTKGIETSDVLRTQKSWMVKYINSRTLIHPPPKAHVVWPDAEVLNARKGAWLYAYVRQPAPDRPAETNEHWLLLRDGKFTNRIGNSIVPGNDAKQMASYLWYPASLMRDSFADVLEIPKLAYVLDPELSKVLPWCLQAHKDKYQVRKQLEEIDGSKCHVVERLGHDVLWIDAQHGFQVRRRTLFQASGQPLSEFRATDFRERAPGVWLPTRQLAVAFNFDSDPKEYQGRVRFVLTNTLVDARFNDLPDDFFVVPAPKKR